MNFRPISSLFSSDLAIDLGNSQYSRLRQGRGIVVNEPSIVAINRKLTNKSKPSARKPRTCSAARLAISWRFGR